MASPTDSGTNWYDMLGVSVDAPEEQLRASTEKLSRQAAALATTAPDRSQQLRDVVRAIRTDLLSGPAARAQYDARLASAPRAESPTLEPAGRFPSAMTPAQSGSQRLIDSVVNGIGPAASRFRRFLQSGWTCPSCGLEGGPADQFCAHCGTPMKVAAQVRPTRPICTNCAAAFSSNDRFCSHCGAPAP